MRERTRCGVQSTIARGVRFGRKPALDAEMIEYATHLIHAGERPRDVAEKLEVGRSTLYRYLKNAVIQS